MSDTRILITGGAGFIGANLAAFLAERGGYQISVLDNESLGDRDRVAAYASRYEKGDIRDSTLVADMMEGVDAVVHLAADTRVMDSIADPRHNFESNVVGTFGLLEAARKAGVGRFINASTGGAIIGEAEPPVHEEIPAAPLSPYGASKLSAEGYCSAYAGAYGLGTVSLRFSNIYGPLSFHKGSVVAHFFKQILNGSRLIVYGDGTQRRDYLFIGDLVAGICRAIESDATGVFQLGSGIPTPLNDLIGLMRGVVGSSHPIEVSYEGFRPGEILHTWCDIGKARGILGFEPATRLDDGLARTWVWFLDNRSAFTA